MVLKNNFFNKKLMFGLTILLCFTFLFVGVAQATNVKDNAKTAGYHSTLYTGTLTTHRTDLSAISVANLLSITGSNNLALASGAIVMGGRTVIDSSRNWQGEIISAVRGGTGMDVTDCAENEVLTVITDINGKPTWSCREIDTSIFEGSKWEGDTNVYRSTGRVGIGTDNPQTRLHVKGSLNGDGLTLESHGTAANTYYHRWKLELLGTNDGNRRLSITELAPSGAERVSILPGGNVGIGTTSPSERLHVNGNLRLSGGNRQITADSGVSSSGSVITLNQGSGGDGGDISITSGSGSSSSGHVYISSGGAPGPGNIYFRTGGTNTRMFINSANGNVGIGTTSPTHRLHVLTQNSGTPLAAYIHNQRNAAGAHGLLINTANTATSTYSLNVQSGGTSRLYVRGDGRVGIGISDSIHAKLHISADQTALRVTRLVSGSWGYGAQVYVVGDSSLNRDRTKAFAVRAGASEGSADDKMVIWGDGGITTAGSISTAGSLSAGTQVAVGDMLFLGHTTSSCNANRAGAVIYEQDHCTGTEYLSRVLVCMKTGTNSYDWRAIHSVSYGSCGSLGGSTAGGGCFLEGTKITMGDGSLKDIDKINVGDLVLSFNESSQEYVVTEVLEVYVHTRENTAVWYDGYYEFETTSGLIVEVTQNHPIYAYRFIQKNSGSIHEWDYFRVDHLSEGDLVVVHDEEGMPIIDTIKELRYIESDVDVIYNLGLSGPHNYFAQGILVHNGDYNNQPPVLYMK